MGYPQVAMDALGARTVLSAQTNNKKTARTVPIWLIFG
jgi:hypothetical protein